MNAAAGTAKDETARAALARALVAFGGNAVLPWLKLLKPGYRHCFVLVEEAGGWILYNPLSHRTELAFHAGLTGEDIAEHYRLAGYEIVETFVLGAPRRQAPVRPYSCVEAVKRALGIHSGRVLTPWQLRQYLKKNLKHENIP